MLKNRLRDTAFVISSEIAADLILITKKNRCEKTASSSLLLLLMKNSSIFDQKNKHTITCNCILQLSQAELQVENNQLLSRATMVSLNEKKSIEIFVIELKPTPVSFTDLIFGSR